MFEKERAEKRVFEPFWIILKYEADPIKSMSITKMDDGDCLQAIPVGDLNSAFKTGPLTIPEVPLPA